MPFVALFVLSKKEGDEVIFDLKRAVFLVWKQSNLDLKKLIFDLRKILFSTCKELIFGL